MILYKYPSMCLSNWSVIASQCPDVWRQPITVCHHNASFHFVSKMASAVATSFHSTRFYSISFNWPFPWPGTQRPGVGVEGGSDICPLSQPLSVASSQASNLSQQPLHFRITDVISAFSRYDSGKTKLGPGLAAVWLDKMAACWNVLHENLQETQHVL